MGLDGGTIISRTDVLRGSSWRLASRDTGQRSTRGGQLSADFVAGADDAGGVSRQERREAAWDTCAISGSSLELPVVACHLGKLYNRESVVQYLLSRSGVFSEESDKWRFARLKEFEEQLSHIKSLKDVFSLHLHRPGGAATDAVPASAHDTGSTDCSAAGGAFAGASAMRSDAGGAVTAAHDSRGSTISSSSKVGSSSRQQAKGANSSSSVGGGRSSGDSAWRAGAGSSSSSRGSGGGGDSAHRWCCPITGLPVGSGHAFSALRPCGHVISSKALKQVGGTSCPVCSHHYTHDDVIVLNSSSEEVEVLRSRMLKRKQEDVEKRKSNKKTKTKE